MQHRPQPKHSDHPSKGVLFQAESHAMIALYYKTNAERPQDHNVS
jgi:hypothetical protein